MKKFILIAFCLASQYALAECVSELDREELVERFNSGELVYRFPFLHKFKQPDLEGEMEIMSGDLSSIRISSIESLKVLRLKSSNKWTATVNDDKAKLIYAADVESDYRKWLFQKFDGCWFVNGFFEGAP